MIPTANLGIPENGVAKAKYCSTPHSLLIVNYSVAVVATE